MDHPHRGVVQYRQIGAYIDEIRSAEIGSSTLIILDHKMKFEPVRYCNTSFELYGKRGIGWNGSVESHLPEGGDQSSGSETVHTI